MKSQALSERLLAVVAMTKEAVQELREETGQPDLAVTVADIGTDHAYLPIYLVDEGIAVHAIASDARKGPLSRAQKNIKEAGLEGPEADGRPGEKGGAWVETRLSDGFEGLREKEAEIAVLSGMGGRLMKRIIEEGQPEKLGIRQLILQPQSEVSDVWRYLTENGWTVVDERMVSEEEKFYTIMRAKPSSEVTELKARANSFGSFLLAGRDETFHLFLQKEKESNEALTEELSKGHAPESRLRELAGEKEELDAQLSVYEDGEEDK